MPATEQKTNKHWYCTGCSKPLIPWPVVTTGEVFCCATCKRAHNLLWGEPTGAGLQQQVQNDNE